MDCSQGKAIETNVRQLRSKLNKSCQFMVLLRLMDMDICKVVSEYAIKGSRN